MGGGYKHAYRWRSGDSVHWVRKQASRSVAARGAAAGGADAPEGVRLPARATPSGRWEAELQLDTEPGRLGRPEQPSQPHEHDA